MKIISWNVNGLRAVLKKGFLEFIEMHQPDILCLQETKIDKKVLKELTLPYDHIVYNCAQKRGYSGTAILSKIPLDAIMTDMEGHEEEGRIITIDLGDFYVVNVYVPNSSRGLKRLPYRTQHWDPDFQRYLTSLKQHKDVIVCGDLNVAHEEIDLTNPNANRENAGFTHAERSQFTNLLALGFVDTFRHFHPEEAQNYSWWSYRFEARQRNIGWRVDYCLATEGLLSKIKSAFILPEILGSDHAPVGIELSL